MRPKPETPPRPALDISALVDHATAGDQRAFSVLYQAFADDAYRLLTRLVGPGDDREDLLQDVFIRFHRALPGYRREAALSTFLYRITVRVAYDHLRRQGRQPVFADHVPANLPERGQSTAAEQIARRQEIEQVMGLLSKLHPKQRIALILREALELSYPEIAELVGCRPATARMRVAAANRTLRRLGIRTARCK